MRKKNLLWIYLVFNWDILVACLTSAAAACAAVESEDVTGMIFRTVYSMRKDADPINDEAVINLWKAKEALPF